MVPFFLPNYARHECAHFASPSHPPLEGGSKFAKQILGRGYASCRSRISTERASAIEHGSATSAAPPRKILRCARIFRPSLKGRVESLDGKQDQEQTDERNHRADGRTRLWRFAGI